MSGTTVAVMTALFPPAFRGGGPIRSTEAMVAAAPNGIVPIVLTGDTDLGEAGPLPVERNRWSSRDGVAVYYTSAGSIRALLRGFAAIRTRRPDVLYFNSFFNASLTILPLLLWRFGYWGKPLLLLAPRGEFGGGALRRRSVKKRCYIALFRTLGIHRHTIWHATAAHETTDIRREWGESARIVTRQNHTLLPQAPSLPESPPDPVAHFAFVGRIVEHKGLEIVLRAIDASDVRLVLDIYGSREDADYASRCERLAGQRNTQARITFRGILSPEAVRTTLAHYDALLMPTAGENFGHIIAESLSVSCPVITTPFTPWTETLRAGAGIIVSDRDPENWRQEIEHYAELSADERARRRHAAGDGYAAWTKRPSEPHVWSLALAMASESAH